jgi:hypothetical protein
MVFMWHGAKVMCRIWMSLKVGVFRDLVDDAVGHLVLQVAVLVVRSFDRRTAASHNSTTPAPVGPAGVG